VTSYEDNGSHYDMMKFLYFRSSRCEAEFKWSYFGSHISINSTVKVITTDESYESKKTLAITFLYLVTNFALIATAVLALCKFCAWVNEQKNNFLNFLSDGLNRRKGGRYFNYYALCVPFIVMNFIGLALDITATLIYLNKANRLVWDISHLLGMLEVQNYDEVLAVIVEDPEMGDIISYSAIMATQLIFFITSKLFVPLLVLFGFGLLSIKTMWDFVDENKRKQNLIRRI
jgi:hypothetical protein